MAYIEKIRICNSYVLDFKSFVNILLTLQNLIRIVQRQFAYLFPFSNNGLGSEFVVGKSPIFGIEIKTGNGHVSIIVVFTRSRKVTRHVLVNVSVVSKSVMVLEQPWIRDRLHSFVFDVQGLPMIVVVV